MKFIQVNKVSGVKLLIAFVLLATSCKKGNNLNSDYTPELDVESQSVVSQLALCAPIPDSLAVPAGNKLSYQTFAKGVQIYEVQRSATAENGFAWINIAPLATLFAKQNFTKPIINHFAGPSWQFVHGPETGEIVVAARAAGVTVDPTAIQWLLLKAVDDRSTPGNKVTFIQRLCTVGGLAPTTPASELNLGQKDSIPYRATYLLYEKE